MSTETISPSNQRATNLRLTFFPKSPTPAPPPQKPAVTLTDKLVATKVKRCAIQPDCGG